MKMGVGVIASRYAKSLLGLGGVENSDDYQKRFEAIKKLLSFKEAGKVIKSKVLPNSLKLALIRYALKDFSVDKHFECFVKLMLQEGRADIIKEVGNSYKTLVFEKKNTVLAEVFTAVEMGDKDLGVLQKKIESSFQKEVVFERRTDPRLLGGVLIKVGNKRIDMSLKAKIERLGASI